MTSVRRSSLHEDENALLRHCEVGPGSHAAGSILRRDHSEGMAQVIDDMGYPIVIPGDLRILQFGSTRLSLLLILPFCLLS